MTNIIFLKKGVFMENLKSLFALLAVLLVFTLSANATNYSIDTKSSKLKWKGEKVVGKHFGTVEIKNGSVTLDNNKMTGNFDIDMTSIVSEDLKDNKDSHGKLVGHLKSDDFFSVDKHPTAKFTLKKADKYSPEKGQDYNYMVTGDLTIKGITNEVRFPAKINMSGNNFNAYASFTIDRTKWNVKYKSGSIFDGLGDAAIYDDIKFELHLNGKSN